MWIKLAHISVQFRLSLNTDTKFWVLWLNIKTGALPVTCPIYLCCIVLHWQYCYGRRFESLFLLLSLSSTLSCVTLYLELHLPFVWNCFGCHSWVVDLTASDETLSFRCFSWIAGTTLMHMSVMAAVKSPSLSFILVEKHLLAKI
jgi:hypothetical protein